jgi:DNA polymerase-3 subunit delta
MDHTEFFNNLKAGDIARLYLFYGQEEYVKEQALAQLKDTLLDGAVRDMNMTVLDGETASTDDILACADTLPLFGGRRLVVIRNYAPLMGRGVDTADRKRLVDYIAHIPEHLCLVFVCRGDIRKNTALFKAIGKYGAVVDFAPLKDKELILWIRTAFKRFGKAISPQDAQYMAMMAGSELETLVHEIHKVADYAGEAHVICAQDIDAVVARISSANIFKMVDAIGQKDVDKALYHMNELLESGQSPIGMLSMIARQFRILLQCRLLLDKGYSAREISSQVKLPIFAVNGYINQLKKFDKRQIAEALRHCLQTDLDMKSTSFNQAMILERLVLSLKNNGI